MRGGMKNQWTRTRADHRDLEWTENHEPPAMYDLDASVLKQSQLSQLLFAFLCNKKDL